MLILSLREGNVVRIDSKPFKVNAISYDYVECSFDFNSFKITFDKSYRYKSHSLEFEVFLNSLQGNVCKMGFSAPRHIAIDRERVWKAKRGELMTIKGY